MKKVKRIINNIINYFKGIRISTIYKLVGILLLLGISFWLFMTWQKYQKHNVQNNTNYTLMGKVIDKGDGYVIVEDNTKKKYFIKTTENILIGYEVELLIFEEIKNVNDDAPIHISHGNISVINKDINNENAKEKVINYFEETENYFKDTSLAEEVKLRFITIVDFLFYNGSIKGYTLNDISSTTKLQLLEMMIVIDNKIENTFPGYKESISNATDKVYTGLRSKIVESFLTITTDICGYDEEMCDSAIKEFQEIKNTFNISWNTVRDLIKNGKDNIDLWYQIYSGKKN